MKKEVLFEKEKAFNSLTTAIEKLKFWDDELSISYIDYLRYGFQKYPEYFPFTFSIEQNEWETLNRYIIENVKSIDRKENNCIPFLLFEEVKKKYEKELRKIDDEERFIVDLLKNIKQSFYKSDMPYRFIKLFDERYEFQLESFQNYIDYTERVNLNKIMPGLHIVSYLNGEHLAMFKKYLDKELLKTRSTAKTAIQDEEFTLKRKALFLYYSNLWNSLDFPTKEEKGKKFSVLLGVSFKNLKVCMSKVKELRKNKDDVAFIYNLFLDHSIPMHQDLVNDYSSFSK